MSTCSTLNSSGLVKAPFCRCGFRAPLRTALTEDNAGRRFLGCARFERDRGNTCGFFKWLDGPTDDHLRTLLYATLQEKEKYRRKFHMCMGERGDLLFQLTVVEGSLKVVEKELMETRKAKQAAEERLSRHSELVARCKKFIVWVAIFVAAIMYHFYVKL